jgi:sec-independent protein translocase protein TatA
MVSSFASRNPALAVGITRRQRSPARRPLAHFIVAIFVKMPGGSMLEGLFQPMHLLLILGLVLLVFGPKKLPELGKGLGDGIRGFKSAMNSNGDGNGNEKPVDAGKTDPASNQAA